MRIFIIALIFSLITPIQAFAFEFNPNRIISDAEFTNRYGMTRDEIYEFLGRGALQNMILPDWQGNEMLAADIIHQAAINNGVNPRVIITLLQKEQSVITAQNPNQGQLDWAAGYAVCDSCSMDDPAIQRWRGFGRQVNSATLQFTEGYFKDIANRGAAVGKYGPGIAVSIGGTEVIPENAATAALYAYTPHIHGNRLFAQIYDNWFGKIYYPSGSLIKTEDKPEIYLVRDNTRHHITNYAVFISMFDINNVTIVSQSIIDQIPEGSPIQFPNFSILRSNNTIYLVNGDYIQPFKSKTVFNQLGFSDDEIIDVTPQDVAVYRVGSLIDENTQYPGGRLVRLNTSGSIFYVENGTRHFVDENLLNLQFSTRPVFDIEPSEIASLTPSRPIRIADGYLVSAENDTNIYLIENEQRRLIANTDILESYGWRIDQVQEIDAEFLLNHALGQPLNKF